METWITLGALALASAVNSALPGPCIALTLARASRGGAGSGLAVTGGILAADLALACIALAALLGLVEISPGLMEALRWTAAVVMMAMGLRMLARSRHPGPPAALPRAGDFCAGLLVGGASPYNLIFFLALLPLYVSPQSLGGPMTALVATALVGGSAVAYLAAVAIGAGSCRLAGAGTRWIETAGALCVIGFGALSLTAPLP